jgi:hypothetical protein
MQHERMIVRCVQVTLACCYYSCFDRCARACFRACTPRAHRQGSIFKLARAWSRHAHGKHIAFSDCACFSCCWVGAHV